MSEYYTEPKPHWQKWGTLYFDPITGEAISQHILDSATGETAYIPSGFFFERVLQFLPANPQQPDGPREWVPIEPWAYATVTTAYEVAHILTDRLAPMLSIAVGAGSDNQHFPTTVDPAELIISDGDAETRHNAGLLAAQFCRYYYVDQGKVIRGNAGIEAAVREIREALAAARKKQES